MKLLSLMTVFIVTTFSSAILLAGNSVGNGGFGVHCNIGSAYPYIETYDYWEAIRKQTEWDLGDGRFSWKRKVNIAAYRMTSMNPSMADDLSSFIENPESFHLVDSFVCNGAVVKVPMDMGQLDVEIPNDCKIVPLATHVSGCREYNNKEKVILIDKTKFNKMSEDAKAALILHEYLYKIYSSVTSTSKLARLNVQGWAQRGDKFDREYTKPFEMNPLANIDFVTKKMTGVLRINSYLAAPDSSEPLLRLSPIVAGVTPEYQGQYIIANVGIEKLEAKTVWGSFNVSSWGSVNLELYKNGQLRCIDSSVKESRYYGIGFHDEYISGDNLGSKPMMIEMKRNGKNILLSSIGRFCLSEDESIDYKKTTEADAVFVDDVICYRAQSPVHDRAQFKKCLEGNL